MTVALLNGASVDETLARSRGLHYGDGVFRTLLVHHRRPHDLGLHLDRLEADCRTLRLAAPDRVAIAADAVQLAQTCERGVLKIIVTRRSEGRGYRSASTAIDRLLLCDAPPHYPASCWESGIVVFQCAVRLASQPRLAGAKHLNRLEQVLASLDWPEHADEGLMLDADGHPVCGTRSNLFWATPAGLFTPALDRCGVEGVTRRKIMDLASQLQVPVNIVTGSCEALFEAREIFVSNSLIGIWPVREIPDRTLAAPGLLTRRLMQALDHPRLA